MLAVGALATCVAPTLWLIYPINVIRTMTAAWFFQRWACS